MSARVAADTIIIYLNEMYNSFTEIFSARNQPQQFSGFSLGIYTIPINLLSEQPVKLKYGKYFKVTAHCQKLK